MVGICFSVEHLSTDSTIHPLPIGPWPPPFLLSHFLLWSVLSCLSLSQGHHVANLREATFTCFARVCWRDPHHKTQSDRWPLMVCCWWSYFHRLPVTQGEKPCHILETKCSWRPRSSLGHHCIPRTPHSAWHILDAQLMWVECMEQGRSFSCRNEVNIGCQWWGKMLRIIWRIHGVKWK